MPVYCCEGVGGSPRVPYLYLSLIRLLNTVDSAVDAKSTAQTERLPADDGDERDLEPEPSPALKGDI